MLSRLVRLVDELEAKSAGYLELEEVRSAADDATVRAAMDQDLLLVDFRRRLDPSTGDPVPLTVCRLNRRHPLVRQLLDW
jgi:hypothetical protein